jgi:uncharacterized protein (TIGR02594 family)
MIEYPWMLDARKHLGLKEIAGRRHAPKILRWWALIRAPFTDDETPWCAAYVGGVLESTGIKSSRSAMARSYLKWGRPLIRPTYGAVVVFWRGSPSSGSGHVGFVVGQDPRRNLMVLGGNQGNEVSIKPFDKSRVLGYRWPDGVDVPGQHMPVLAHSGGLSINEA